VSSTTESLLNINPPCDESSVRTLEPRKPKSPTQLGYKELRDRVRYLESDNAQLAGRNQFLEERHAEDRDSIEALSSKLAAYDKAETQLRQAADAHVAQSLVLFNARAVAVRQKFPDFDAVIELKPELRQDLLRAVVQMEKGPFVLYSLIKSPDFCRQLNPLPLGAALEKIFHFVIQVEQKLIQESVAANYLAATKGK
jgi:hypothetical protein